MEDPQWNCRSLRHVRHIGNTIEAQTLQEGREGGQANAVRLPDLNHFQVHLGSDFTCVALFQVTASKSK